MQDKCIDGKCKKHKKNISQGQSESVLFFAFAFFFLLFYKSTIYFMEESV